MLGLGLSSWAAAARMRGGPQAMLGPALLGWWDAERVDRMALAGSNVTSWTDLVGGYPLTQAMSGFKPLWSPTEFGGRAGVRFDGTDDYLELTPSPFPVDAAPCEIWVLASQDAPASDPTSRVAIGMGTSNGTARRVARGVLGGVNRAQIHVPDGTSSATLRDAVVDYSGGHLVRGVFASGACALSVDGGAPTVSADVLAGSTAGRLRLGAYVTSSPSSFWQGVIHAVLVTAPLSAAQAAQLTRWGKDRGAIA